MSSSLRALQRNMLPTRAAGGLALQSGDVFATMTAITAAGIEQALVHLLGQFPQGFTFDLIWTGNVTLPVDETGRPLPPEEEAELRKKVLERREAAGKILRPKPTPGVVNQEEDGIRVGQFERYTIIAIAAGDTVPKKVLPMPDPRNTPQGDLSKH